MNWWKTCFDLACGQGRHVIELAGMKAERFYGGYDLSEYSKDSRRLIVLGVKEGGKNEHE